MAIKTISQFAAATPAANDKILFEQNGEGKSTTIGSLFDVGTYLIWERPISEFEPQTISLDLSSYRFVDIVCSFSTDVTNSSIFVRRFLVGEKSQIEFTQFTYDTATDVLHALNGCYRSITVTTTGITFGSGHMIYNGNGYKDWNNRSLPFKTYGVK